MIFKYAVLKRPCTELGVGTVRITNDESKNGVFCTSTGGIYLNSIKSKDYIYIPSHNISFVAFEATVKEEPKPEPKIVEVKKVEERPKTESVKENGTSNKTNSREVPKTRTPARKPARSPKTTRKPTTKNS